MPKPRKPKNEEQKVDNSEALVRHQKLCLSIDLERRRIFGYTELEIVVPDNGIVGLHADNLVIESVTVDGEQAEFEVFPHYVPLDSGDRWCSVSSASSAADAAGSVYLSCLERELVPNLLIMCSKSVRHGVEQQQVTFSENEMQNVKLVHIDYWVEKAETGIHIEDDVVHTDNQIRRARCWFPCMDDSSQHCCYDLEFTVAHDLVAASTGTLLYQVLSKDDPPRKTYVYRLSVPVAARWVSLVVAPFEILPDLHSSLISHLCLPSHLSKLRNTVGFLHSAYSHYEKYLSAKFPFCSYTQVFIAPKMAVSSLCLGASMSIFSSQILFDETIIDQTIDTRIKLAYALARQWFGVYITAEAPNDEWLLDGLAGFLTDSFIKHFLGNNEARYRRYKANCVVCKADISTATALSSSDASKDLYGTQSIGFYGKLRSWKSVSVFQMLEKQMGPESFCKILKNIVASTPGSVHFAKTLSTKEFRRLANEVGNLERPFLREFFPRWVGSSGCPVLKMGFSYNKRKNMVELAVFRGCTSVPYSNAAFPNGNPDNAKREGDAGWPGMMSIRVHEIDGMYDHPVLPLAGETLQLFEIQCHSKLAAKRFLKPRKGSKQDGSEDNIDTLATVDMRSNVDAPLLWLRADPEMEYLAQIDFNQPVQMWINQLEKDKDVVAQVQAITALEMFPQISTIVNALSSLLSDSQAFWRVRIEAALTLASTACEETDWAGLLHLIKFYKSQRFDAEIGLPKPNDFHDFAEYFVLEAIPHAIALVRAADNKSPREAVEFILQLLKYNDNNGNPYSDVFWLATLVQSMGELEIGQQSVPFLSSLLKRIDRLLQFDRLIPSYNGILTVSCIRTLTQIAMKISELVPLDRVADVIKPFRASKARWQVRIEAARALLDLEFHCKGIDAALCLFIRYLDEEESLRGQVKLSVRAMRLCQLSVGSDPNHGVESETLVALLRLLESSAAFNNVGLRHYVFCILQVLAGRPPTLCGVPRDETLRMGHAETCSELKNIFAALVKQCITPELPLDTYNLPDDESFVPEASKDDNSILIGQERTETVTEAREVSVPEAAAPQRDENILNLSNNDLVIPDALPVVIPAMVADVIPDTVLDALPVSIPDAFPEGFITEAPIKAESVPNGLEPPRKTILKIRVKQSSASSRAEDLNNPTAGGGSSSVSVEAPQRSIGNNQNLGDVTSCHDVSSRVTASIGSAKLNGDENLKELQCTADSSNVSLPFLSLPTRDDDSKMKYASLQSLTTDDLGGSNSLAGNIVSSGSKGERKKDKEKKHKRDGHKSHRSNPEHSERKRLKDEKKQKQKEMAKILDVGDAAASSVAELKGTKGNSENVPKMGEPSGSKITFKTADAGVNVPIPRSHKIKIKLKGSTLSKS